MIIKHMNIKKKTTLLDLSPSFAIIDSVMFPSQLIS